MQLTRLQDEGSTHTQKSYFYLVTIYNWNWKNILQLFLSPSKWNTEAYISQKLHRIFMLKTIKKKLISVNRNQKIQIHGEMYYIHGLEVESQHNKFSCRVNTFPIKIMGGLFLIDIDKLILKFIWQWRQGSRTAKTILKNNEVGKISKLILRLTIHIW